MMRSNTLRKRSSWTTAILSLVLLYGVTFVGCSVKKTEEGNLPEYEVTQTEEGNLPAYDVDAADVEIGTETKEIEVPTVDVKAPDDDDDTPPAP